MQRSTLSRRSLTFHWRTNVAVTLGVAIGAAALTGALIVGDSMRGSLRAAALGRLGRIDHALVSSRYFREALAGDLTGQSVYAARFEPPAPIIILKGGATHADSAARAGRVTVLGVTDRFWELATDGATLNVGPFSGRSVILNEPLALELGAKAGDDVLLRFGKPGAVSTETLLGRRETKDTTSALRLTVHRVIPAEDLGAFSLNPRQFLPHNAFVPLSVLQRSIDRRDRVNALLVVGISGGDRTSEGASALQRTLKDCVTLGDLGLKLRIDEKHGYVSLESEAMLLEPSVETAARTAAEDAGVDRYPVQVYLANRIAKSDGADDAIDVTPPGTSRGIPYSTIAAIPPGPGWPGRVAPPHGEPLLQPGEILLNEWSAADLGANVGDRISLDYYVTGPFGKFESRTTTFSLRAIVPLAGSAADPGFTPEYKGVTDTKNLADWDPPFPMDLKLIRDKDEAYWDEHRTTPKAFVGLADGRRLWAEDADRFGTLTSIRLTPRDAGTPLAEAATNFDAAMIKELDLASMNLSFDAVRERLALAGSGTTDFGGLFIGFSFFLIASAAMLVALLFRLGVERRAPEIGLLLSTGYAPRTVARLLIAEGAVLAAVGGAIGLVASLGYAWLMLAGLRSWWSDAVNTPFLRLYATPLMLAIGFVASFLVALGSIAWSIRGLTKLSARDLLAGTVASGRRGTTVAPTRAGKVAGVFLAVAVVMAVLPAVSDAVPRAVAFFLSGASMLTGCLALFTHRLKQERPGIIHKPGITALVRLGTRNARRQAGRSMLTTGLIASATFLIAALGAFHMDADVPTRARDSGSGGYSLYAESAVPLIHNPNTTEGREALNISTASADALTDTFVMPLRLRPGDESGCVNLYRPTEPRILGAPDAMIARGGFVFASTMSETDEEKDNPWTLLSKTFDDGAIPVIGDVNAVMWQLHLGLGKDLMVTDEQGREVALRFVALLAGSALQDELIVAEAAFGRLFPSIGGYGFFLIDAPLDRVGEVEATFEQELAAFSFDVRRTADRLTEYMAVQNTYLSTFQTLGGFGLILGTIGLAAVLLRNTWERRGEIALLRALGYSRRALGGMVMAENVSLLVIGLVAGSVSAAVAIAPHVVSRSSAIPWLSLGLTLFGVFSMGVLCGLLAVVPTLRAPLLPALRSE